MAARACLAAALLTAKLCEAAIGVAAPGLFGIIQGAQLVRLDPINGDAQAVGPGVAFEAVGQNLAAIDPVHGVYYILAYNLSDNATNLIGLDLTSGAITSDVPTPFILPGFFATGECFLAFSAARGKAVLAGQMQAGAPYTFVLMDPATGAYSVIASLNTSKYGPVGYAPSVLVPSRDEFIVMYAVNPGAQETLDLISIDLATGGVAVWDADCGDAVVLDYDASADAVFGIGQDRQANFERALYRFDPSGRTCTRLGDIAAFETLVVGEGAIDSHARVLYWTAMPTNATRPPWPPVDLIGTSLVDATTVSAHPYTGDGNPAQLRFLN